MSGNNLDFHGKLDQVDWVKEKIVAEFKSELTNLETEVANSTLEAALKSQDSAALETAANNVLQKCLDDMKVEHMTFKMMIEKRGAAYVLALQIKLKLSGQNPGSLDGMRAGDTRKAVEARQIAYNTANPTAIIKADGRAGKNTLPLIINSSVIANPAAAPASGAEVNENAPDITEMIEGKHYEIKNGVFTLLVEPKTLQKVTYLNVVSKNITDISALKGLTGLTDLSLGGNNITDISALKELTGLTNLSLRANNITDISALKGLTGLTYLSLGRNNITDITALKGMTGLTNLSLRANNITDISALKGLTGLTELDLGGSVGGNNITDITALKGLTGLTYLSLGGNNITDISALKGMTGLTNLSLRANNITDISALKGLTGLTDLDLGGNNITDITALRGMTGLTDLGLRGNNITDISTLSKLTKLGELYLGTQGFPGLYQNGYKSQLGSILPTLNQLTKLQVSYLLKNDPIIQQTKILHPKITLEYEDA